MDIRIRERDNIIILDLEGTIDINASNLVETVGRLTQRKRHQIICNFENVEHVDYIGVSLLAVAYKNILNNKGKMVMCNVRQGIRETLSVVGLERALSFYESEDEALAGIRGEDSLFSVINKQLRRRFKRITLHTDIEYRRKFSHDTDFYKGRVVNLSALGVFTMGRKIFSVGDILTSRLYLLPEPGTIELETKVVWIADKSLQPAEYPGMGLEFYNLDQSIQKDIVAFVERHLTHSAGE